MLQACAVESCQRAHLRRLEARIDERDKAGYVGGVEHHHHMLHIGTVLAHVLAELCGNLGIALQKVLAGHAGLTGGATAAHHVAGTRQSLADIGGIGKIDAFKSAMVEFLGHTFEGGSVGVVKADVRRKTHHHGGLCHIGANHTGRAHNDKFIVR